jgi:uncharacterized membrane protein
MTRPTMDERALAGRRFEQRIGRLLVWATYIAVALLLLGVVLMIRDGISPLDATPPLDVGSVIADVLALEPTGFLWLGLAVVIATPISRVIVAAVAYARAGDRMMVAVSLGILLVITIGIVTAVAGGA